MTVLASSLTSCVTVDTRRLQARLEKTTYSMNIDWFYDFSLFFNVEDYWHIFAYHLNAAMYH